MKPTCGYGCACSLQCGDYYALHGLDKPESDQNTIKKAELIRRLDASIAWLERGEVLPEHSACIGLDDIKTIKRLLQEGM